MSLNDNKDSTRSQIECERVEPRRKEVPQYSIWVIENKKKLSSPQHTKLSTSMTSRCFRRQICHEFAGKIFNYNCHILSLCSEFFLHRIALHRISLSLVFSLSIECARAVMVGAEVRSKLSETETLETWTT